MSGWKEWQIGEVVEAADFQSYVQDQVIQVYTNSAARGSALGTAVSAGMLSYLTSSSAIEVYNGTAWASISNPGDITAVTAGTGLSGGGTTGDITLNVDLATVFASPNITGTATIAAGSVTGNLVVGGDLSDPNWTAARVLTTSGSTAVTSTVTTTELGYLSGVSSAIQTQLNAKLNSSNGAVSTATAGSAVVRNITISTAAPTGGQDGDVWLRYS